MVETYKYPLSNIEEKRRLLVWQKGSIVVQNGTEFDSNIWRSDIFGHIMKYSEHGNAGSSTGWEMGYIKPSSHGGSYNINNLQPLFWRNNRNKGDTST